MSASKAVRGQSAVSAGKNFNLDLVVGICLILATLAVYAQVGGFDFVNIDDPEYVTSNAHVQAGITPANIEWAFTASVGGNWMPVTLLSHMLDCQLFGLNSGMQHLMNVLFHLLATLLLYATLQRATHARWPSAFVALVFAVHPLHVESVAWIAERKDVLSALLFFLALYAYVRYAEAPDWRRYLVFMGAFAIGLMAKPMLVTFPFVLLLFDFWPLQRVQMPKTLWEKLPLVALSAADSIVTYIVQGSKGAMSSTALASPAIRVENALDSYVIYIGKMFYPTHLAWFYWYPDSIPLWQPAIALLTLLTLTALAIYMRQSYPYFIAGWFWYLGMLVPVIGLVQVGAQARADRYMYLPMVGLAWIVAWGVRDVLKKWPGVRVPVLLAGALSCTACLIAGETQASYWQNSMTLDQRTIDATQDNLWARYYLAALHYASGNELMNSGRDSQAAGEFEEAIRVRPSYPEAHNNLAIVYARMPGHAADAISEFEAAIRLDPKLIAARRNLAMLLASIPGREPEAISQLEAVQLVQPDPAVQQLLDRLREKAKAHQ